MRRASCARAAAVLGLAAAAPATLLPGGAAASRGVNYCQVIPIVNVPKEAWGYHAGRPITGARGTYSRGHGQINLAAHTANGILCQVDRVRNAPDREIVARIQRRVIHSSHYARMFGVPGNIMKVHIRVTRSTDRRCRVGTIGTMTIFASYNNVHRDAVVVWFPRACRDHRHRYTGPSVTTNVPPN